MAIKYVNASNPAAYGVQWVNGDNGNTYQLMNPRWTTHMIFGVKPADQDRWITTKVIDPSRFGMTDVPTSYKAFLAIASAYAEA